MSVVGDEYEQALNLDMRYAFCCSAFFGEATVDDSLVVWMSFFPTWGVLHVQTMCGPFQVRELKVPVSAIGDTCDPPTSAVSDLGPKGSKAPKSRGITIPVWGINFTVWCLDP